MGTRWFFSGFVVALVFGVPLSLWIVSVAADQVPTILSSLVAAIMVVVILVCIFVAFRRRIFEMLRLRVDARLQDTIRPAVSALDHALGGNRNEAVRELGTTAHSLASWYVQSQLHRWLVATLVGLLAAFAAILGSALLARQNALIVEQNRTLTEQNESLREQIKLNVEQVKLALAQVQAAAVSDTARTGRELMLKAWEDNDLRPLVDPSAPNKNPKKVKGFVKVLIQHYVTAYQSSRRGNFPDEYRNDVERDTRMFFCAPSVREAWKDVEKFYGDDIRELANRCE